MMKNIFVYKANSQSTWSNLLLGVLFMIAGCTDKELDVKTPINSRIVGSVEVSAVSSQAVTGANDCVGLHVNLKKVLDSGDIGSEVFGRAEVAADGTFDLSLNSNLGVLFLDSYIYYVLEAEGCSTPYYRPLTGYQNQNINLGSSLVTLASFVGGDARKPLQKVKREEFVKVEDSLNSTSSQNLMDLLNEILANPQLTSLFENLVNVSPVELKDLPPVKLSIPNVDQTISENVTTQYMAGVYHWNTDYVPVFEWTLNGQVVSRNATWDFVTTKNSQGNHQLLLEVGMSDANGFIDRTKLVSKVESILSVTNNFPPIAPAISAVGGLKTNSLTGNISINTGAQRENCGSFSSLSLSENSYVPPVLASEYNITCTSAGNQLVPYVFSLGEGVKNLALWAKDSVGNISAVPSIVTFILDQTQPVGNLGPISANLARGSVVEVAWSASDLLSGLATVNLEFAADGVNFSTVANLMGQSSPYMWTVPGVDTTNSYLRLKVIDLAGNEKLVLSANSFSISALPVITIASPAANSEFPSGATISGTCDSQFSVVIGGTGVSGSQAMACAGGTYSSAVTFSTPDGIKTVSVSQTNAFGLTTTVQKNYVRDSILPVVSISSPASGSVVASTSLSVFGTCETGLIVQLSGAGLSAPVNGSCTGAAFNINAVLTSGDGLKSFAVSQSDNAGNVGTVNSDVVLDQTPPIVMLLSFDLGGFFKGGASYNISYMAADGHLGATPISVDYSTDNGVSWNAISSNQINSGSEPWTLPNINTSQAKVRVTAVDSVGNTTSVSSNSPFVIDSTASTVVMARASGQNQLVNSGPVHFMATFSEPIQPSSFTVEDILQSGTATGITWSITNSGDDTTYYVDATSVSGQGTLIPTLASGAVLDKAGNASLASNTSGFDVVMDLNIPILSAVTVNGQSSTITVTSAVISVNVAASDDLSGVTHVRLKEQASSCQSVYADDGWQVYTGFANSLSMNLSFSPGPKRICAWAKDAAGNVSLITANSDLGTDGVDSFSVYLDLGSPPTVTSFSVVNGTAGVNFGTTVFSVGDQVQISWTVNDTGALAVNPVTLYYTVDNSTWVQAAGGAMTGSPGSGATTWSSSYSGFNAPTNGFFRIKIVVADESGNSSATLGEALNSSKWSIFAGNESDGDGESALSARLGYADLNSASQFVVATSNGDIYVSESYGLRKINAQTGVITKYLSFSGAGSNIPGTVGSGAAPVLPSPSSPPNMIKDNNDNIYLSWHTTSPQIFKINTKTGYVSVYAGGGTSIGDGIPASQAYLLRSTRLSIDPATNSLYLFVPCSYPYSMGIPARLAKITQNPDGTAGTLSLLAGNCVEGNPVNGSNAMSSPLENGLYQTIHGIYFHQPTGAVYFWFVSPSTLFKLINGKLYTKSGLSPNSFSYSASQNRVYFTQDPGSGNSSVSYFVPTSSEAFDEVFTHVIKGQAISTDTACNSDNIAVTSACARPSSIFSFPDGSVGYADGPGRNAWATSRIRTIDGSNKVQTVAGTLPFSGYGLDRKLARFGSLWQLRYKSSLAPEQTLLPGGLYFGDGVAMTIGRVDFNDQKSYPVIGTQVSMGVAGGSVFGPNNSAGTMYNGWTAGTLNFSPAGLMFWANGPSQLARVGSNGLISMVNGTSTQPGYQTVADGTSLANVGLYFHGTFNTFIFDNNNNLYVGPKWYDFSGASVYRPLIGRFDLTTNKYYKVIGNGTNASSADCSIPGCATTASILSDYGLPTASANSGAFNSHYDSTNERLFFAEGTKIRYIEKPYDPAQATLGTLLTAARSIYNFNYIPGNNHVYYINGSTLYCKDLSGANPAGCNDTALTLPSQMGSLSTAAITRDDAGNIYVLNGTRRLVYKYTP